jgi:hypothetical protein
MENIVQYLKQGVSRFNINTSTLSEGVYILHIKVNSSDSSLKIIKN